MGGRTAAVLGAALGAAALGAACGRETTSRSPAAAPAASLPARPVADSAADSVTGPAAACAAPPLDPARARVTVVPISDGSRGMITAVRWARSPDGCALLVVEDPVSVEADPVPDVATLVQVGADGVRLARRDSLWDVQPDAAWRRLALGMAHVAVGREAADTLPARAWAGLARATGLPERVVRAGAFASSGMSIAYAVAQPAVWPVDAALGGAAPRPLPLLGGWRVRWAPGAGDAAALLVGDAPATTQDDAPARRWLRVDPASGRPAGTPAALPAAPATAVAWHDAPLLDVSTAVDLRAAATLRVPGATVVGEGGVVSVLAAGAGARLRLGPGVPIAAAAHGRAVLALAPRVGGPEWAPRWQVVLYRVD